MTRIYFLLEFEKKFAWSESNPRHWCLKAGAPNSWAMLRFAVEVSYSSTEYWLGSKKNNPFCWNSVNFSLERNDPDLFLNQCCHLQDVNVWTGFWFRAGTVSRSSSRWRSREMRWEWVRSLTRTWGPGPRTGGRNTEARSASLCRSSPGRCWPRGQARGCWGRRAGCCTRRRWWRWQTGSCNEGHF